MTMGRIAALMILASMAILIWVSVDMRGGTAIWFAFVGHPLLGAGLVLGFVARTRRLRREATERAAAPGGGPPTA